MVKVLHPAFNPFNCPRVLPIESDEIAGLFYNPEFIQKDVSEFNDGEFNPYRLNR